LRKNDSKPMTPRETSVYELNPAAHSGAGAPSGGGPGGLPESLLRENELWSCRFRWMVVAVMIMFGTFSFFPAIFRPLGFRTRLWWPFVVAGLATISNILFLWHAGQFNISDDGGAATVNLWSQIGIDLILLTGVVHYTGSVETYISFAYLFHVILACIFFSRRESLLVTTAAAVLYIVCVELENIGIIPLEGVYAGGHIRDAIQQQPLGVHLNVFSAVAIWFVVWYLASALSAMVRQRETELEEANTRLERAQQERTRHMLRTTHELKAPFTAIMANSQLLLEGHCGELPEETEEVVRRISDRSERLAAEIQEMLQLANLTSESSAPPKYTVLSLNKIVQGAVEKINHIAEEKNVTVEADLEPAEVAGAEEQLEMLFHNLLANAVFYSHRDGTVRVETAGDEASGATARVSDNGIGIPEEKLPSIFDEYYRTNEAVRQHKESTGLGLAIVKQVAEEHGARIRVESAPEVGTSFTVQFPPVNETSSETEEQKDGLHTGGGR